jgi:hypothetical protein
MHSIKEYNWLEKTKVVVEEYDNKVLIPMLMKVFKLLNPRCWNAPPLEPNFPHDLLCEDFLTWKNKWKFVKIKSCPLYCHIDAYVEDLMFPLLWWRKHESRFPNVGFFAWQILGILHKLRWNVSSTFVAWSQAWNYVKMVWKTLAC